MALGINATSPLTTPTYDGSGQAIHPSVVDAVEVTGSNWNGHRYWMAMTPYPDTTDDFENPSILVSDDKITWSVPAGLTNPVVPEPVGRDGGHNSDTDLLLEPDGSNLRLFYRESALNPTDGNVEERIFLTSSSDGVNWTAPDLLFSTGNTTDKGLFLSPAAVKINGTYHLYGVKNNGRGMAHRTASAVSGPWVSEPDLDVTALDTLEPWHIACRLESNGVVRFTVHATPDGGPSGGELWIAESSDPWVAPSGVAAIIGAGSGWDANLYRGCVIQLDAVDRYGCYYSANDGAGTWGIGYTEILKPGFAPHYNLEWRDVATQTTTQVTGITDLFYDLSGLTETTDYEFRVQETDGVTTTAFSAWEPFTTTASIDGTAPSITSVSVPAAGTYALGDVLTFTPNWNEAVTVTGVPAINLDIGGSARQANYSSGSGTAATAFTYTVQSGDLDTDGVTVTSLTLDGGTIKDSAGNDATLTLNAVGDTSGVLVDGVAPVISVYSQTTTDTTPTVTGAAGDATSLTLVVNGATYNPVPSGGAWSQTLPTLALGEYSMTLNGTDAAGNSAVEATGTLSIVAELPKAAFAVIGPVIEPVITNSLEGAIG